MKVTIELSKADINLLIIALDYRIDALHSAIGAHKSYTPNQRHTQEDKNNHITKLNNKVERIVRLSKKLEAAKK